MTTYPDLNYEQECDLLRMCEAIANDFEEMGNTCTAADYRELVALCRKLQVRLRKYEGTDRSKK